MRRLRPVYFHAVPFREALEAFRRELRGEYARTDPGDPGAYWEALAAVWDDPRGDFDLLTVEQDIVVHAAVRPQLARCPRDWCEFRHPGRGDPRDLTWMGLGCDRFSARARKAVPSSVIAARPAAEGSPLAYARPGVLRWDHIDGPVYRCLLDAGFECHEHVPPVRHLTAEGEPP